MPMSDKKRWIRLAVAAGLGAAAGAWTYQIEKDKKASNAFLTEPCSCSNCFASALLICNSSISICTPRSTSF